MSAVTHSVVRDAVSWNAPSGRVVRALKLRDLWVLREGDEPMSDDVSPTNHVLLPYATIFQEWPVCPDAPTTFECTSKAT